MNHRRLIGCLILSACFFIGMQNTAAQEKLKFAVAEFAADPFDLSARDKQYEKFDGSGDRYAVIKVKSTNPVDNLSEYNFNFGNMKHIVEEHDGALWIYVQRNAKMVSISRKGYIPLDRYDLQTTIEAGKNYVMTLSAETQRVLKQMVQFKINPSNARAVIMVKNTLPDSKEELFGNIDETGSVVKSLQYGTYTYKILSDKYHLAEGRFSLNDRTKIFVEDVELRPNFSEITFEVDDDAEIYVNGERMGIGHWKGDLKTGEYLVECRKINHKTNSEFISVKEGEPRTIRLKTPTPITGTLAITSTPLGAEITINDKNYGVTPRSIDLTIVKYIVDLKKAQYTASAPFEIKENETTGLNIILTEDKAKIDKTASKSETGRVINPKGGTIPVNNRFYIEVGANIGSMFAYTANIGVNFHKFNAEIGYSFSSSKSQDIFWNDNNEAPDAYSLSAYYTPSIIINGRLGYSIYSSTKFCLTPQIGFSFTKIKEHAESSIADGSYCGSLTIDVRSLWKFSPHFGICLCPEYRKAISKSSGFETLSDISSKIKNFGEGFNLKLAIVYSF